MKVQYIDNGPGYLHGKPSSITPAKNGTCTETTEFKLRDQIKVAVTSKWKPKENGAIPCPSKDMGGCSKGTLNLRCIYSENWMSQLLLKAKEIAQKCKLKEMHNDSELHCSCPKYKGVNDTSGGKLRKAAARENSDDNYVFCPAVGDAQLANLKHFQYHLFKGEPIIVTNVLDSALGLSWEPMVMWRACRQSKKTTDVLNCLNWCEVCPVIYSRSVKHKLMSLHLILCLNILMPHDWESLLISPFWYWSSLRYVVQCLHRTQS